MKKLSMFLFAIFIMAVSIAPVHAGEFELGALKFEFVDSTTVAGEVTGMGRFDGRGIIATGMCSGYAKSLNVADVFSIDILSFCGLGGGTYSDGDPGRFSGIIGISPFCAFGCMVKVIHGYDFESRKFGRLGATSLNAMIKHDIGGK